jgi:iron donor protein CyaY
MKIKKKKFHQLVDNVIFKIEQCLDNYKGKLDIDYENNGKILKINLQSKNIIILTRQEFLKQIWIATEKKGYYFELKKNHWICKKNKYEIFFFLKKYFIKYIKEDIF